MKTVPPPISRYALSFTSGALLMQEAVIAAPIYLREHDWAKVRKLIEEDNLLQARTVSTGQRVARELVQRLAVLTDDELELMVDATTSEQGHLLSGPLPAAATTSSVSSPRRCSVSASFS